MKIYIIWKSSGSFEDFSQSIYKVYSDELVANAERDRLNQELKELKDRYSPIQHCNGLNDCDICETKALCDEFYNDGGWMMGEQWEYTVEGFEVEDE